MRDQNDSGNESHSYCIVTVQTVHMGPIEEDPHSDDALSYNIFSTNARLSKKSRSSIFSPVPINRVGMPSSF